MKRLLIIIDGMADLEIPEFGFLSPAESANMEGLRLMKKIGNVFFMNTIPAGNEPATDVALLNILGYDVPFATKSRSWFEALGFGIKVGRDDLCLRCNFISQNNGLITSHSGGRLRDDDCEEIIHLLNKNLSSEKIKFNKGCDFRNIVIIKDCSTSVYARPPHELIGEPISQLQISCDDTETEFQLNKIIREAPEILKNYPSNAISLWAPGKSFTFDRKICGTMIAGVGLVKGIGLACGLNVPDIKGATGDEFTDYKAKLNATLEALENDDFVILHIEAPDEASHQRNPLKKRKILEEIDREILQKIIEKCKGVKVTVQSDHATSSLTGKHLSIPVEVVEINL